MLVGSSYLVLPLCHPAAAPAAAGAAASTSSISMIANSWMCCELGNYTTLPKQQCSRVSCARMKRKNPDLHY